MRFTKANLRKIRRKSNIQIKNAFFWAFKNPKLFKVKDLYSYLKNTNQLSTSRIKSSNGNFFVINDGEVIGIFWSID